MGIYSTSVSIIRYKVNGEIETPAIETIRAGLQKYQINDLDDETPEKIVGWTCFDRPFEPDFSGSDFIIASYFVFSLRIDKKTIPPKLIQKQYSMMASKQLRSSGREYLSRQEKKAIKDHVTTVLSSQIPPTPNVFDIIWDYENNRLYFLSTLKAANEELETLFFRSFNFSLKRIIPFTFAESLCGLSDSQKDLLLKLTSSSFMG